MNKYIVLDTGSVKSMFSETEVDYEIRHGCNLIHSLECDSQWGLSNIELAELILKEANGNEKKEGELLQTALFEDRHWDWFSKSMRLNATEYNWFYLYAEDKPQGACVIFHPKESLIDSADIFYVEYLAVAPWNRNHELRKARFTGVGTRLLVKALDYGINRLGLRPGFSLHSLPKARGFYKRIGMIHYPELDKEEGLLSYFEIDQDKSIEFQRTV